MKKYIFIILAILVLAAAATAAFVLLRSPAAPVVDQGTTFPVSSTTNPDGSSGPNGTIIVAARDGGSIETKDFIDNGVTVEDSQNKGNYYLAGSVGYCNDDGSCPSGAPSDSYHVVYFSENKAFIIGLINEPLGKARLDAEQFLMKTLGITQQQMCYLNYEVLTTSDVNEQYAGENLGFSFCPGAVKLP